MCIFDGFHSLPPCALEFPQVDFPIGVPCQQDVALYQNSHKQVIYQQCISASAYAPMASMSHVS